MAWRGALEPARQLLRRLVAGRIAGAVCTGMILAWLVTEHRCVAGAACLLAVPAALFVRGSSGGRIAGFSALYLPFGYLWFGGIVFLQSPMWLCSIAAWRDPSLLPMAAVIAVITLSQTAFHLRYRYY